MQEEEEMIGGNVEETQSKVEEEQTKKRKREHVEKLPNEMKQKKKRMARQASMKKQKYKCSLNPQHWRVKSRKKKGKKDVNKPEPLKVGSQQEQMQTRSRVIYRKNTDAEIQVMLVVGWYDAIANTEKEQHEWLKSMFKDDVSPLGEGVRCNSLPQR